MATAAQREFARNIYVAAQKATDIAPEFVTAQAILESGWGKARVGKYNLFGITKGSRWTGKTVLIKTHEYFNTPQSHLRRSRACRVSMQVQMWKPLVLHRLSSL